MSWFSEQKRAQFEKQFWDTINEREEFKAKIRAEIAAKKARKTGKNRHRGGKRHTKRKINTLREIFLQFSKKNRD